MTNEFAGSVSGRSEIKPIAKSVYEFDNENGPHIRTMFDCIYWKTVKPTTANITPAFKTTTELSPIPARPTIGVESYNATSPKRQYRRTYKSSKFVMPIAISKAVKTKRNDQKPCDRKPPSEKSKRGKPYIDYFFGVESDTLFPQWTTGNLCASINISYLLLIYQFILLF